MVVGFREVGVDVIGFVMCGQRDGCVCVCVCVCVDNFSSTKSPHH
jgi:hypothetical protein